LRLLQAAARILAPTIPPPTPAPLKRVLLLRPDHIGDVLLTAPAVALLRASLPDAHLTYLVGPWSIEAARRGPHLDDLRALAFPGFTRQPKANVLAPYALLARVAARLRQERFDAAIVLRPDHWWGALLALVAGVPVRVGGATPETITLLTHAHAFAAEDHAAERALGIARLALRARGVAPVDPGYVAQYSLDDVAQHQAASLWRQHRLGGRRVVILHPAAGAPLKSWPAERWEQLADALINFGCAVALTGAPSDAPMLSSIGRGSLPVLCGQSLEISASLYQRSDLVISVDSGAAHLAAVVGTPTLRLFGPVPASVFGPWPARPDQQVLATSNLACAPCGHVDAPPCGASTSPACMLALGVDDVMNVVRRQLGQS
jgi:ADP-heptose:LPS heptosyltransferase